MIHLPELINHTNASSVRDEGLRTLQTLPDHLVDGSTLRDFDSSILAVLLAWKRIYPTLVICRFPAKLEVLARVYGLTDLFEFKEVCAS